MTMTRWRSPLVLAACLLASLCANVYLTVALLGYVERAAEIRLDPAGLKTHAAERGQPSGPALVFFGDSRSAMWSPPAALSGYRIVNRGVGYQTTAQMLLRIDEDVVQAHPKMVVVEAGVNDLRAIASFPQRRTEIIADCEANLARIVTECRRAGATVVLVTVFGIGDVPLWRRLFWSSDVSAAIGEVNAFLPKLTGEGVVLFDANPALMGADGKIQRAYQFDYLHLSPAGYEAINAKLVPVVSPLLK